MGLKRKGNVVCFVLVTTRNSGKFSRIGLRIWISFYTMKISETGSQRFRVLESRWWSDYRLRFHFNLTPELYHPLPRPLAIPLFFHLKCSSNILSFRFIMFFFRVSFYFFFLKSSSLIFNFFFFYQFFPHELRKNFFLNTEG